MTLMRLVFLPPVLPLHFAFLNFVTRNRHYLFREITETLERFRVWLAHVRSIRGLIGSGNPQTLTCR
jgi:hypothetical protein